MGDPEPLGPEALRYLADAERALGPAAPQEREEVLSALRDHIALWCRDVGLDPERCPYEEIVAELGPPSGLAEHGLEPEPTPTAAPVWEALERERAGGAGDVWTACGNAAAAAEGGPLPRSPLGRAAAWSRRTLSGGATALSTAWAARWRLPRGNGAPAGPPAAAGIAAPFQRVVVRVRSALRSVAPRATGPAGAALGARAAILLAWNEALARFGARLLARLPASARRPVLVGVAAGVPAAALVLTLAVAHPWRPPASRAGAAGQGAGAAANPATAVPAVAPESPTPPRRQTLPPVFFTGPTVGREFPPAVGGSPSELASLASAASEADNAVSAAEQRLLSAQRQETAVEEETGSASVQQITVQRDQAEIASITAAKAQAQAAVQAAAQALRQDMARQAGIEATLASPAGLTAAPAGAAEPAGLGPTALASQVQSVESSVWEDASRLEAAEQRESQLQSQLTAATEGEQQAMTSEAAREVQFAAERTQAQAEVQSAATALQQAQQRATQAEAALQKASAACAQASAVTVAVAGQTAQAGTSGPSPAPAVAAC